MANHDSTANNTSAPKSGNFLFWIVGIIKVQHIKTKGRLAGKVHVRSNIVFDRVISRSQHECCLPDVLYLRANNRLLLLVFAERSCTNGNKHWPPLCDTTHPALLASCPSHNVTFWQPRYWYIVDTHVSKYLVRLCQQGVTLCHVVSRYSYVIATLQSHCPILPR